MKKIKLILVLIVTLLVLLSSTTLAATGEDFGNAIASYVSDMARYNDRFAYTTDSDTKRLGYNNKTISSSEYDDTVLGFDAFSWIGYVYNQVTGLDMTNDGKNPCERDDIINAAKVGRSTRLDDIFEKAEGLGNNGDGQTGINDNLIDNLIPGDMISVHNEWDTAYIYIGGGNFACFSKLEGKVNIVGKEMLKGKNIWIARLKPDVLKNVKIQNYSFNSNSVQTDATTIDDALNNLKLKVTIDSNEINFYNSKGNPVSQKEICEAVREGSISKYGKPNYYSTILFFIEYKDNKTGNISVLQSPYDGFYDTFASMNYNSTNQSNKLDISLGKKLDKSDYEDRGNGYFAYDYFQQGGGTLKLGIYATLKDNPYISERIFSENIEITNGKLENDSNGKSYIGCFEYITKDGKTLAEYLETEIEIDDYVYQLDFSSSDMQKIEKENGKFKSNNFNDEIVFNVNETGIYTIKIYKNASIYDTAITVDMAVRFDDCEEWVRIK